MVGPEVGHHLEQLPVRPGLPDERRLDDLLHRLPAAVADGRIDRRRPGEGEREPGQQRITGVVVDAGRGELTVKPALRPGGGDLGEQRGGDPERRPTQQVQREGLIERDRGRRDRRGDRRRDRLRDRLVHHGLAWDRLAWDRLAGNRLAGDPLADDAAAHGGLGGVRDLAVEHRASCDRSDQDGGPEEPAPAGGRRLR